MVASGPSSPEPMKVAKENFKNDQLSARLLTRKSFDISLETFPPYLILPDLSSWYRNLPRQAGKMCIMPRH